MVTLLVTIYTGLVLVLFKMKLVKPRPYPIALVVVAGILLIGGIVVVWRQCAPMSGRVVTTQYVIPLVPYVKGQVKKIHAQANQPVKRGDLLLEINPEPYQYKVNQLQAQLQAANAKVKEKDAGVQAANAGLQAKKAGVTQAQAALKQAKAGVASAQAVLDQAKAGVAEAQAALKKAQAQNDLAKTEESIAVGLQKVDPGAISTLKVAQAVQNRKVADAAVTQAQSTVNQANATQAQTVAGLAGAGDAEQQAEASLSVARDAKLQAEADTRQATFALQVAQSEVPAVSAQLDDALFNLRECKMLAPTDGYVVNWQVQEGTMLVSMPMAPAGTFINTADTFIAAAFPQNYLNNVEPGNEVELVLDPYPGKLFKGKVDCVIPATGEGQFTVSGNIPDASKVGSQGLLAVKIVLTDGTQARDLPLGAGGAVAIYTNYGKPVHIISKVSIRMKKWLLYVLPS
jgi:multidrug resistance efflux pump